MNRQHDRQYARVPRRIRLVMLQSGREQGSRDWRMLPIALITWAASLAVHLTCVMVMNGDTTQWVAIITLTIFTMLLLIVGMVAPSSAISGAVLVIAMLLASMATVSTELVQWHDPASRLARQSATSAVTATMHIDTPITVSDLRDADCQTDATLASLFDGTIAVPSHVAIRLFASGSDCTTLAHGATIQAIGILRKARFGKQPLWLVVDGTDGTNGTDDADNTERSLSTPQRTRITVMRRPNLLQRIVGYLQQQFFTVTEQLDDQGRVLVPGLTLGVLGQDYVNIGSMNSDVRASKTIQPLDEAYTKQVEEQFRRAGIMHLMAVSGGHFMLVADLVRRLCARLLLPRRVVSCCVAFAYMLLASMMYPSDSVLRALIMGLIGATASFIGRRGQSVSALSWTMIGVLLVRPSMAYSYGFALSCAAVLGIVLFAGAVGDWCSVLLPRLIAEPLAMTIAAQTLTLPIQVLMEPELPLASIPANLLVSPFVGFATIAGLGSLLVSWISPQCGFALAWVAGRGTQVMERIAAWLSASQYAVVPWAGNLPGALLMFAVEAAFVGICVGFTRAVRRRSIDDPNLPGRTFRPSIRTRIAIWFAQTKALLEREEFE